MNTLNKEKAINTIVSDFNDSQIHNSYYFKDSGVDIIWNRDREVYLILKQDKTFDYSEPRHLESYVEDLTTKDLKEYLIDKYGDWEDDYGYEENEDDS
tara:strand:- start:247 stop:540 length:294 start_codon:yes stop_codon:yes gene_type:complete